MQHPHQYLSEAKQVRISKPQREDIVRHYKEILGRMRQDTYAQQFSEATAIYNQIVSMMKPS